MLDSADRSGNGDGTRVQLDRVLRGLRHLEGSYEPARVFAGLVQVCVPALCDECLIEVAEEGARPYRIRRVRPGLAPLVTADEEPPPEPAGRTGTGEETDALGVTVEVEGPWVRARFASSPGAGPSYRGMVACRWHTGYLPAPSDWALIGVLVDHAVALIHRERSALTDGVTDLAASVLPVQHRVAAASGILMALYHLSPAQARQLLSRASEHTSASIGDIADTVLRTGALLPPGASAAPNRTDRRKTGPIDAP